MVGFFWFIEVKEVIEASEASEVTWLLGSIRHGGPSMNYRECVRNLDLRVRVHPGELWVSKQRVYIVLEASK